MKYRYKIEIELDDEKIIREGKYEIADIYATIRSWFAEEDIPEVDSEEGVLAFASNKTDDKEFARFALIETTLVEKDWFLPYAKRMTWYDTIYGVLSTEDVLKVCREEGLI